MDSASLLSDAVGIAVAVSAGEFPGLKVVALILLLLDSNVASPYQIAADFGLLSCSSRPFGHAN